MCKRFINFFNLFGYDTFNISVLELQALGGIAAVLRYPLVELEFLTVSCKTKGFMVLFRFI
jgi:hypothetical protein